MLRSASPNWRPPVVTLSAAAGTGIDAFWAEIERYRRGDDRAAASSRRSASARPSTGCGR